MSLRPSKLKQPQQIVTLPIPDFIRELPSKTTVTGKRKYEVEPGVWYPSVTTVLGESDPEKNAAIEAWRVSFGRDKADAHTKKATDRGTEVHNYLDQWLTTFDVNLDPETVDVSIRAPFNQLRNELRQNLSEVWVKEVPLYSHQLKTAGRVDLIGKWNGKPAIIDFKTANKKKTEEEIHSYFLQATTYSMCWYELSGELIEDIVILIGNEKLFKPQRFERTIYPYLKDVQRIFGSYKH